MHEAFHFDALTWYPLARNSFEASFAVDADKAAWIGRLNAHFTAAGVVPPFAKEMSKRRCRVRSGLERLGKSGHIGQHDRPNALSSPRRTSTMPGPARAGLFIYALDRERIAAFYAAVAGMARLHEAPELIVLESADIQLLVHAIPPPFAEGIRIASPPVRRENTALKFFFTVHSLVTAREMARTLGGEIFTENWAGPGFTVCNGMDPEGNVFQVREFAA